MSELEKINAIIKEEGWNLVEGEVENGIELEISQFSPAGRDFSFNIVFDGTVEDLAQKIEGVYEDFDVDEEVEMWVEARKNGVKDVPDVRTLVYDAEKIDEMLEELDRRVSCYQD